jgi:subtilisin family serine protease
MNKPVLLFVVMASALLVACGAALAQVRPPDGGREPERYIVVLNDTVSDPGRAASAMASRYGFGVGFVYGHALKGFSAKIPEARLNAVRSEGRVAYVEHDRTAHATVQALPWGIDRIDADLSSTLAGDGTGSVGGVNAFVIDTGIDASHPDLNVVGHRNFTGDGKNYDCNGHGTHVAGTIAAKDDAQDVVGVAPGAPLTGVKVLGCKGAGSYSGIIKGIDWVTANAAKPAVANMSLGGPTSQALDDAVRNSAASGVFYSVAAGNDAKPACDYSPARAGLSKVDTNSDGVVNHNDSNGIVTTAATNATDEEASFSNYGKCVDIWAPGVGIPSTKRGGGTTTMSGTSMATPHVGGGAALYLSISPTPTPTDAERVLKANARTLEALSKAPSGTRYITLEYVGGF